MAGAAHPAGYDSGPVTDAQPVTTRGITSQVYLENRMCSRSVNLRRLTDKGLCAVRSIAYKRMLNNAAVMGYGDCNDADWAKRSEIAEMESIITVWTVDLDAVPVGGVAIHGRKFVAQR
jgi:hypothetical protein